MLISRTAKFLLSLPAWWLFFFTIKSTLLVSKKPEWLGLYSTPKILFIVISITSCSLFFYFIKKLVIPKCFLTYCENLETRNIVTFLVISIISSLPFLTNGVKVGEDIGGQVKSSLQWINGEVNAPNILSEPRREDLSTNQEKWSLRPPGAAILPTFGMLLGLSLGQSIKLGLLFCSVTGGAGWLIVFKKFNVDKHFIFIAAISLGLKTGTSVSEYATANIILFAFVPWFLLLNFLISERFRKYHNPFSGYLIIAVFLFFLGCFAWIKLSGIIVSGTIGACLFFTLVTNYTSSKKIKFILTFGILGFFFWSPLLLLEKANHSLTGNTADQLYGANDSDIQAPLFGKFWGDSTKGAWLIWSLVAALGYSLPIKSIAHSVRDFGIQFEQFTEWIHKNSINEHVLLCGLVGLIFSIILLSELKRCWQSLEEEHKVTMYCFFSLPFIGLGILAYRYEWNYLLYHAHTFEFWLIYTIPTLLVFSFYQKLKSWSVLLFGIIVALPLGTELESKFYILKTKDIDSIGITEKKLGLSSSRFSSAIDAAEKDSESKDDVLYFLPAGDMGDLVLRTKLRTLATHFAGDNFQNSTKLYTTKQLNVYCTYDSSLLKNQEFKNSMTAKFPQLIKRKTIFSGNVIVEKLELGPLKKQI